jgi:HD-GYP domain-containing protein (c-di-GMP phosphodiesterase class II)
MEATLTYKDTKGDERVFLLNGGVFRIGRLEDNDLFIDNPYVSRYHAEIVTNESSHHVRDLDSTSGTFVNGERVKHRHLRDGDLLRLGRGRGIELTFHTTATTSALKAGEATLGLRAVRVIAPEDTLYLNTSKLPPSGDLGRQTVERLRGLYEFSSKLLAVHSIKEVCNDLCDFLLVTLKADRCAVLIHNRQKDEMEVISSSEREGVMSPSRSITNLVFADNVAILSLDAQSDERFADGDSVRLQSVRSVICTPIGTKTRMWGVCYVDNVMNERAFNDESLDFVTAVARQAGMAMENIYLLDEQRRSLESFMSTLAASLDARDDNTAGHSARVGAISAGIAKTMGLGEEEERLIYYAGLLHDYGKIGVRDDVLLKPAELTPEEYAHAKEHPLTTFRLLSKIRFPEDLADIPFVAAAHHERWDGTGYPHGLKGEEIPLGSRIVSVADAYDALTEERCYHEPWSPEKALIELTTRAGTYFDPAVIEAFVKYFSLDIEPRNRRLSERKSKK